MLCILSSIGTIARRWICGIFFKSSVIESDPSSAYKIDAKAEVHMYILDIQIDQSLKRHRNNKEKDGDYAMQTRRPVVFVV